MNHCKRCYYRWTPRVSKPRACPQCHSKQWRKNKKLHDTMSEYFAYQWQQEHTVTPIRQRKDGTWCIGKERPMKDVKRIERIKKSGEKR